MTQRNGRVAQQLHEARLASLAAYAKRSPLRDSKSSKSYHEEHEEWNSAMLWTRVTG